MTRLRDLPWVEFEQWVGVLPCPDRDKLFESVRRAAMCDTLTGLGSNGKWFKGVEVELIEFLEAFLKRRWSAYSSSSRRRLFKTAVAGEYLEVDQRECQYPVLLTESGLALLNVYVKAREEVASKPTKASIMDISFKGTGAGTSISIPDGTSEINIKLR
jgi:hypothetical protein